MYKPTLIPNGEIAVDSYEDAAKIAEILLKNGNVVMISREENLYVVNFIWSQGDSDRNDVVFMDRASFEMSYYERCDEDDSE